MVDWLICHVDLDPTIALDPASNIYYLDLPIDLNSSAAGQLSRTLLRRELSRRVA